MGKIRNDDGTLEYEVPQGVTWSQVSSLLDQIVHSKPDGYAYRPSAVGCKYWHANEGTVGCLIGQLLDRLGVPAWVLAQLDCLSSPSIGNISAKGAHLEGMFDEATVAVLAVIQSNQDGGRPWLDAWELGQTMRAGILWGLSHANKKAIEAADAI